MVKNFFKTALRNILQHRFYSIVNVIGLFAGITFALLIGAYVWGELQVNAGIRNAGRHFLLRSIWKDPNNGYDLTTLGPLAKRLKEDYPSLVADYYRWDGITSVVAKGDKRFRESIQLGDGSFLKMYGFPLETGNAATALADPFSAVIARETAIKYFGRTDVVGQTLAIQSFSGNIHDFVITGVLKDLPPNSVTKVNDANRNTIFLPTSAYGYFGRLDFENWGNFYIVSLIELRPGVRPEALTIPIKRLIAANCDEATQKNLHVQPVGLKTLYMDMNGGLVRRMLFTLSFVGIFILLMAMVNFVNIAIGASASRMREIGVRKVLGSSRRQLVLQFLTESLVLVVIAAVLALTAFSFVKPLFAAAVGKAVPPLSSFPFYWWIIVVAGIFLLGLLAGIYPAFFLSSLKSVESLKGKLTVKENVFFRKALLSFQFSTAVVVMIAAAVVTQQVSFFFSKNLGYNKEFVVSAQVPRDWSQTGVQKMETVRDEFARMPEVSSVSLSYEIPNGMNGNQPRVYRPGIDSTEAVPMQALVTDSYYLDTYQVPLVAGGFLGKGNPADSGKVVLNEKACAALGWDSPAAAVGQTIRIPGDVTHFVVAGVTKDFHFGSMQQKIAPVIFFNVMFAPTYRYLSFKLHPGNIARSVEAIGKRWAELLPGGSFEYSFMEDTLAKLYATEIQLKKAAYTATALSLVIVLLGIVGLVSLSIHRRVKEIGIRKVLGASLPEILAVFVREFIVVMAFGAAIACPAAYLIMRQWLNGYEYRVGISPWVFAGSVLALLLATVSLVVLQSIKAALANPAKSLKIE